MTLGKTVLVLGGGIGGTVAATRLRRLLPPEHRVVLVERESTHVFAPSFLWVMIGERSARQISRPMTALAKRRHRARAGSSRAHRPDATGDPRRRQGARRRLCCHRPGCRSRARSDPGAGTGGT